MPEDGIDFAEYESPEDDPIHPRSFNKIAEGVQKLITKYDFAYSRLQESVNECDDGLCRQIAAEVKWRRKRERYAQCYIRQHQSRNKPARCPGPQYHFEVICLTKLTHRPIKGRVEPDICVWFPRKLWLRNCPRVDWPLPLKDGEMERYEKETILAAIYDFSMKGGRRIADGLNLEHYDKLTGIESSEGTEGGVKQIPAKHLHHLERWLRQFEKDLQFLAVKGDSDGAPPGEWSLAMTGAEAARRLTGKDKARFRDVEPSLKETGFERTKGKNTVRIRLDTLSPEDRIKIQNPAEPSTILTI